MSHRGVEITLGRLATDGALRQSFLENPVRALGELAAVGIELSAIELAALGALDPEALQRFALALDARLQRAVSRPGPAPDTTALDQERRAP